MSHSDLEDAVAANVRDAITRAGENPHSVALGTGIPRVTLLARLNGHQPFNIRQVGQIARHLDVDPIILLAGTRVDA